MFKNKSFLFFIIAAFCIFMFSKFLFTGAKSPKQSHQDHLQFEDSSYQHADATKSNLRINRALETKHKFKSAVKRIQHQTSTFDSEEFYEPAYAVDSPQDASDYVPQPEEPQGGVPEEDDQNEDLVDQDMSEEKYVHNNTQDESSNLKTETADLASHALPPKNTSQEGAYLVAGSPSQAAATQSAAAQDENTNSPTKRVATAQRTGSVKGFQNSALEELLLNSDYNAFEAQVKENNEVRFQIEAYSSLAKHLFSLSGDQFIEVDQFMRKLFFQDRSAHVISQSLSLGGVRDEAADYSFFLLDQLISGWSEERDPQLFKQIYVEAVSSTLPETGDLESQSQQLIGAISVKYSHLTGSSLEVSSL